MTNRLFTLALALAGVRCTFVGHPSLEDATGLPAAAAGRREAAAAFRSRHALG